MSVFDIGVVVGYLTEARKFDSRDNHPIDAEILGANRGGVGGEVIT